MTDPRALVAVVHDAVSEAAPDQLPGIIGTLAAEQARARAKLTTAASPNGAERPKANREADTPPALLTPKEAAAITRAPSVRWLNRRTKGLRFRRDLSRKQIRYERRGLLAWLSA